VNAVSACRSCGASRLATILDLGEIPLVNALPAKEDLGRPDPLYPLVLAFCPDCYLLQITCTIDPEELFREYLYFSSYSDTMLAHARSLVERVVAERNLGKENLAVEIASNDGYLLCNYQRLGIPILGIEPARNIAQVAEAKGIPTIAEFFGRSLADRLAFGNQRADVMHAHNVLAHVSDLNGVVAGIRTLLAPGGVAVVEAPYARDMIERLEFDTIYHEHLCYFSISAVATLLARHRLVLSDVERVPIHGGSIRLWIAHPGTEVRPSVAAMLAEERALGMTHVDYYRDFAERVSALRGNLIDCLRRLKAEGNRIAAYGAAAKGAVLLNYAQIDGELIDFVVDRSPHKQGRYLPGVRIPIRAPDALLKERPDYVLLLAWNFEEEIRVQQAAYLRQGGRFIVPVPVIRTD
jgi:SAM-dependent methyltransferase